MDPYISPVTLPSFFFQKITLTTKSEYQKNNKLNDIIIYVRRSLGGIV